LGKKFNNLDKNLRKQILGKKSKSLMKSLINKIKNSVESIINRIEKAKEYQT
jgi:hypothetical protein